MRYRFVKEHEKQFRVAVMCRVLRVSRSGYHASLDRPKSEREKERKRLLLLIEDVHKKSRKTYGSPRIYRQLVKDGIACSRGRVARLMRNAGIRAKQKRKFVATTDSKHDFPVAKNILDRQFDVVAPNKVWAADITYIPTEEGWLYLAGVLDLCTKTAVGWSMGSSLEKRLVIDALGMAYLRRRPSEGLLHHSDRGCQYASMEYRDLAEEYGMQMSMSRKGNCWDNAPMESFFGTLKKELVHHKKYRSREEARRDIFEYIEVFYNRQRLHSSLGYKSPAEFESEFQPAACAV